ncbi:MAG: endonuclease/exonuclease/phosphatase family protein [Eubacteriales bacterium]
MKLKKPAKVTVWVLVGVLGAVAAVMLGYLIFLLSTYNRLEDNLSLEIEAGAHTESDLVVPIIKELNIITWNMGFGAYSPNFDYILDGGSESRAPSDRTVRENMNAALALLYNDYAGGTDFFLLQEIDTDATRSHRVDQKRLALEKFDVYYAAFGSTAHTPYLRHPLSAPLGKIDSGMFTLSFFEPSEAVRRSLPTEEGLRKFSDLDRCYTLTKIPVENGRYLCLYNVQLPAYTKDPEVAKEQLRQLLEAMDMEVYAGNYVIAGGDFGYDLLEDSAQYFESEAQKDEAWAPALPDDLITALRLVNDVDFTETPTPSCRKADSPYQAGKSLVLTTDGFLVSGNVRVELVEVIDTGFAYSDHNPVRMTFHLLPMAPD